MPSKSANKRMPFPDPYVIVESLSLAAVFWDQSIAQGRRSLRFCSAAAAPRQARYGHPYCESRHPRPPQAGASQIPSDQERGGS